MNMLESADGTENLSIGAEMWWDIFERWQGTHDRAHVQQFFLIDGQT